MKNLFPIINNRLTNFLNMLSLLFSLVSIPIAYSLVAFLFINLYKIHQLILQIIEIVNEILNSLLEGFGSWSNTILPIEPSFSDSQEPNLQLESNSEEKNDKNKSVIFGIIFLLLVLTPYLSDTSINELLIPFLVNNKNNININKTLNILVLTFKLLIVYLADYYLINSCLSNSTLLKNQTNKYRYQFCW